MRHCGVAVPWYRMTIPARRRLALTHLRGSELVIISGARHYTLTSMDRVGMKGYGEYRN